MLQLFWIVYHFSEPLRPSTTRLVPILDPLYSSKGPILAITMSRNMSRNMGRFDISSTCHALRGYVKGFLDCSSFFWSTQTPTNLQVAILNPVLIIKKPLFHPIHLYYNWRLFRYVTKYATFWDIFELPRFLGGMLGLFRIVFHFSQLLRPSTTRHLPILDPLYSSKSQILLNIMQRYMSRNMQRFDISSTCHALRGYVKGFLDCSSFFRPLRPHKPPGSHIKPSTNHQKTTFSPHTSIL